MNTFRLLVASLMLAFCLPAAADVLELHPGDTVTLPTCSVGGGSSISITDTGYYELHVSGEMAEVCYAASCATGGMERKTGNHGATYLRAGTTLSCRSAAGSAVVQLVPGGWVR